MTRPSLHDLITDTNVPDDSGKIPETIMVKAIMAGAARARVFTDAEYANSMWSGMIVFIRMGEHAGTVMASLSNAGRTPEEALDAFIARVAREQEGCT